MAPADFQSRSCSFLRLTRRLTALLAAQLIAPIAIGLF